MLDFRILGPLEVLDDDRRIELRGARQRAVLAILLLHRGETVPTERIVDLMWGEEPPATAVKTVQVYVSHLRRALVEDVITSSRGGYVLDVDPERIDALRFERLLDEGRFALAGDDPAARRRPSALGAGSLARAGTRRSRLRALRAGRRRAARGAAARGGRGAQRGRSAARPARRGRPGARTAGARAPVARADAGPAHARPLPVRPPGGRAGELPRRPPLADRELGLEPGRELRGLEQAILDHDPALDLPRARGARGPATPAASPAAAAAASHSSPQGSRWRTAAAARSR